MDVEKKCLVETKHFFTRSESSALTASLLFATHCSFAPDRRPYLHLPPQETILQPDDLTMCVSLKKEKFCIRLISQYTT